jgi:hypothetical protein
MDSLQIAAGFLLLILLACAAFWFLRGGGSSFVIRFPWKPPAAGEETIQRSSWLVLSPQHSLHSVEWRGCRYLLASSPGGIQVVDRQSPPGFDRSFVQALESQSASSGETER